MEPWNSGRTGHRPRENSDMLAELIKDIGHVTLLEAVLELELYMLRMYKKPTEVKILM